MHYFSIPDSHDNFRFNIGFLWLMKENPEWFYDDFQIKSAYGVPGNCIWNGNRCIRYEPYVSPAEYKETRWQAYKDFGISYRLIFTNFMMREVHYLDTFANALCKEFNKEGAEVMVSTPEMVAYLREHYPNLVCNWSTTTDFGSPYDFEGQIEKINELSRDRVVVLPYTLNEQFELLKKLRHPENIEILVDEKCMSNCPRRREHEIISCMKNLCEFHVKEDLCLMRPLTHTRTKVTRIHRKDLQKYVDLGINLFKIEGRTNGIEPLFVSYLHYMVKDECKNTCFERIKKIAAEQFNYKLELNGVEKLETSKIRTLL